MTTSVVPEDFCSHCGKRFDRATDPLYDKTPTPGAITICIDCGHVMAFAVDMHLRELTDEEMVDIAGNSEIRRIQAARGYVSDKWRNETKSRDN